MKTVMLSIQPKWVEKIASGEKTIEVRITAPAFTPFKCYIYCTKENKPLLLKQQYGAGFDRISKNDIDIYNRAYIWNGKVIGEFVCDKVENVLVMSKDFDGIVEQTKSVYRLLEQSCLTLAELHNYADRDAYNAQVVRGWHISDLVIYDKPKELGEFRKYCGHINCPLDCPNFIPLGNKFDCNNKLARPPQSWYYVKYWGSEMSEYTRMTGDIAELENEFCEGCTWNDELAGCTKGGCRKWELFYDTYEKLKAVENEIEAGTLVKLPCKVGDTVYYFNYYDNRRPPKIDSLVVTASHLWHWVGALFENKNVFTTRAEAEKRLEELRNEN